MNNFNLIISGYGGQGVITLADLISKIALKQNLEVKQAELHGLAQRGGSVQTHVRFGKNIYSAKVARAEADLVIALDLLEAGRSCYWSDKSKTIILSDSELYWPYDDKIETDIILNKVKKMVKKLEIVDATKTAKDLTGNPVSSNVYMLGAAISKNFLPFEKDEAWHIVKQNLKPEYLELNQKVYQAAFK